MAEWFKIRRDAEGGGETEIEKCRRRQGKKRQRRGRPKVREGMKNREA